MSVFGLDYDLQLLENILSKLDITLSALRDDLRGTGNRTLTDLYNKLDLLDNALGSVATDKFRASIVDALPAGTNLIGKIAGDQGLALKQVGATDGRLDVYASYVANPPNLDVALSSRASESTLSSILSKLDVALSTRSSESTLSGFSGKFPSATALGDALSNPTTTIIGSALLGFDGTNWERVRTDGANRLKVQLDSIPNPPNLDVALSTRASETTLSGLSGKFPSAVALSDALGNPTTTIIGGALLGWDGANWRRMAVDSSSRLRSVVESMPSIPTGSNIIGGVFADFASAASISQQVGTTEVTGSAIDVRRGGRKIVYINNTEDVSIDVTIEGSRDGTDWYPIRSSITVGANSKKFGILNDAHGYVRAKAVAAGTPTTGTLVVAFSRMT